MSMCDAAGNISLKFFVRWKADYLVIMTTVNVFYCALGYLQQVIFDVKGKSLESCLDARWR